MTTEPGTAAWTSDSALQDVRPQVKQMLLAVPAFAQLPEAERQKLAADTVKVLSYMRDPNAIIENLPADTEPGSSNPSQSEESSGPPLAEAQADPVNQLRQRLAGEQNLVGQDFEAGAVRQGVEQFGELVQKVDFPKFVGGLIKNVFQAIVESSIEQMRAYGELISNVAKTVDQFMADNISQGAGRDYLADKYPDVIGVGFDSGADAFAEGEEGAAAPSPTLVAQGDNAAVRLAEISKEMNVNPPVSDLSDANAELRLVTAARLEMAKSRQQLLSSMVMLGINRIVITDGSINAKVIFDMRASDRAQRSSTASMHDRESQKYKEKLSASYGSWYSPYSAEASFEGQQEHVATVGSAVDESSESRAEVKARLSGEVRVNFKSDYLPLDKMATPEMMSVIQGNSMPYNPNQTQAGAGGG